MFILHTLVETGIKKHPSDVKLSERLAFLGNHGSPIEDTHPLKPLGPSQHHFIEGFKGGPPIGSPMVLRFFSFASINTHELFHAESK